jgi:repressor LexA
MDYLFGRKPDYSNVPTSTGGVWIPVLGEIAAGIPIEAVTDIIDYEEISAEMAANGEYFALKIKGNSMEPRIVNGDVVIIRKQETAESGDVVAVLVNGESATVKKIKIRPEGIILIRRTLLLKQCSILMKLLRNCLSKYLGKSLN